MNTKFDVLDIKLSITQTQRVVCPKWETPVLQAQHGDSVVIVDEKIYERRIPSPDDEFTRLALRYGPKNESNPYVSAVYGNFGPGVAALRAQIVRSLTDEPVTPSDYRSLQDREAEEQAKYAIDAATMLAEARALQNEDTTELVVAPTQEEITAALEVEEARITKIVDASERANILANPLADNHKNILGAQGNGAADAETPEVPAVVEQDENGEDLSGLVA